MKKKEAPISTPRLKTLLSAVRNLKGQTGPGHAHRNLVRQEHTIRMALVCRGHLV